MSVFPRRGMVAAKDDKTKNYKIKSLSPGFQRIAENVMKTSKKSLFKSGNRKGDK